MEEEKFLSEKKKKKLILNDVDISRRDEAIAFSLFPTAFLEAQGFS